MAQINLKNSFKASLLCSVMLSGLTIATFAAEAENKESILELDEIIVTARKKSELIINVPMNITAVGSKEIQDRNLTEPEDLYRTLAGAAEVQGTLVLRGLSGSNNTPNTTSTFTDGVPTSYTNKLFDVARIEILRGPQGTLWGSNAIGGTVQVITNAPNLMEMEVFGSIQAESEKNRDGIGTRAYVGINIPLVEYKLGLRVVGHTGRESKKTTNTRTGFTGSNRDEFIRAQLLWQASDNLRIKAGYIRDKTYRKGTDVSDESIQIGRAAAAFGVPGVSPTDLGYLTVTLVPNPFAPYGFGGVVPGFTSCAQGQIRAECRANSNIADGYNKQFAYWELGENQRINKTDIVTLNIDYDDIGGLAAMSYVGSYQKITSEVTSFFSQIDFLDLVPTWNQSETRRNRITQEIRFSSIDTESPLSWTVGAFYDRGEGLLGKQRQYIPDDDQSRMLAAVAWGFDISTVIGENLFNDPTLIWKSDITPDENWNKEFALFGEINYVFDLGDAGNLELTGGLRYFELSNSINDAYIGHFGNQENDLNSSENGVRKKISISWRPAESFSVYGLFAEGYRPGNANAPLAFGCLSDPAAANFVTSYKSDRIKNYEIGVKGSLFDRKFNFSSAVYRIDWTDVQIPIQLPAGCVYTGNGATARTQGIEFESTTDLTDSLMLMFNASYTNAKFTSTVPVLSVAKDDNMTMVPKYNAYIALQQEYSIFDKDAFFRASVALYGSYKSDFKAADEDISDAYATVDISTSIQANDNISISFHVQNLLNKQYTSFRQSNPNSFFDSFTRKLVWGRERTFILRTDFNF